MDTKSKSSVKEVMIFIGAIFCMIICMISIKNSFQNAKVYESYFSTKEFENHISDIFEKATANMPSDKLNENELIEARIEYTNELNAKEQEIEDQYSDRIGRIEYGDSTLIDTLKKEKDKKISDLRKNSCKTDEQIKQYTIKEKKRRYENDKNCIKKMNDLKYYIKNNSTGKVDTNLEEINKLNNTLNNSLYSMEFPEEYKNDKYLRINNYCQDNNCKVYFIVPSNIKSDSTIYQEKQIYESQRKEFIVMNFVSMISLVIFMLLFAYIKKNWMIYKSKFNYIYNRYMKIPIDVRILLGIMIIPIVGYFFDKINLYRITNLSGCFEYILFNFIDICILSICFTYYLCIAYDLKRLMADEEYLKLIKTKMILNKIFMYIKEALICRSVAFKVVGFSVITTGVSCAILLSFAGIGSNVFSDFLSIFAFMYVIVYFLVIVPCVLKNIGKFNKIVEGTKMMTEGDLNFTIDVKEKGILGELANNINNIKEGYNKAVAEEIKSQKFKSELITNVSHDLKTPLTSIINYIKLLQQEDISKEEIEGYIGVLDRKSERLKTLIEDLFEASKVSTGAVELNIERLDVVSLLKQSLGEFSERIENSSLNFRINLPSNPIYCNLDGKKTWRLFENLIGNILKYSQENTRVYIDLQQQNNEVVITMKNISAYEMNFQSDELFERFKRGDESRSTEGSGLGLAIANSIAELLGGRLDIEIDGDLFKAITKFKIIK